MHVAPCLATPSTPQATAVQAVARMCMAPLQVAVLLERRAPRAVAALALAHARVPNPAIHARLPVRMAMLLPVNVARGVLPDRIVTHGVLPEATPDRAAQRVAAPDRVARLVLQVIAADRVAHAAAITTTRA